jgi:hypothetical protein
VKLFPENRSFTTGIAAISPRLSPFGDLGSWKRKKRLRVPPEVSHEGAEPLGINVRVAERWLPGCYGPAAPRRAGWLALVDSGQTRVGILNEGFKRSCGLSGVSPMVAAR